MTDAPAARTALVTGANRGIGLALVLELERQGHRVIAGCRQPVAAEELRHAEGRGQVEIMQLDVADQQSIDALAVKLGDRPIDLLINNAGITGPLEAFDTTAVDAWAPVFDANLYGPVRVMQALKRNLLVAHAPKAVAVSSAMGSIASAPSSDHLAYRCSKAALNMALHACAAEWAAVGIIVASLTPGVVDTDMTANLAIAKISPAQSAAGMVAVIDRLSIADAGRFFRYNGDEVDW